MLFFFLDIILLGVYGVVNIIMLKKNLNLYYYIVGKKGVKEVIKVFFCGDDKEEEKV